MLVRSTGNWNNPDQLIIGDFGLSPAQAQMQMTTWSMLAAPLYMSNDLRTISADYAAILLNKEVRGRARRTLPRWPVA